MAVTPVSKAALATLTEGIRADLIETPIRVSTIYPGYIRSEIPDEEGEEDTVHRRHPDGSRALVEAIEREPSEAYVPRWPWGGDRVPTRRVPLALARMT